MLNCCYCYCYTGMTGSVQRIDTQSDCKVSKVERSNSSMMRIVSRVSSALTAAYQLCCGCCLPVAAETNTSTSPVQQVVTPYQWRRSFIKVTIRRGFSKTVLYFLVLSWISWCPGSVLDLKSSERPFTGECVSFIQPDGKLHEIWSVDSQQNH